MRDAVPRCETTRGAEQVRFEGVEGLIAQMNQDIEDCRRILTRRS